MAEDALRGLTVRVVEDETFTALELEQVLETVGCRVLGPVATVADALELIEGDKPRAALLDVQLLNGMITPVAERLLALAIPFVLVSAYTGPELHKPVLAAAPHVDEPIHPRSLLAALTNAVSGLGATDPLSVSRNG
jgi:CheY-like chemotaxis protein